MMYSTDELRQALAEAAGERTTRLGFADVKRAANRRRPRTVVAGIAIATVPILATGGAIALAPGAPDLAPTPDANRSAPARSAFDSPPAGDGRVQQDPPDPSFPVPANVQLIHTGEHFGPHEELVMWLQDEANGVQGGLFDAATGRLRTLGYAGLPRTNEFGWSVQELDDREGGILDFGAFGATGVKVKVTAQGRTVEAKTAAVPGKPGVSVFWVRRTGVLAAPTSALTAAPNDAVFTAYAAGGAVLGTTKEIQRTDDRINFEDQSKVAGDRMRTGITFPDGGELVFYFDANATTGLLQAGKLDAAGKVTFLRTLTNVARPPVVGGFYRAVFDVAEVHVRAAIYVGTASKVQLGAEGATDRGSAAWSAHPELRVLWCRTDNQVNAVAYDDAGNVVAATDFR
ncbi:hypothetical protein ACQP00_35475 [Dactylosporangium sp. CS-047395]|uniref:hypothetical protein n=1 Tax=Dactylosporangium sp. CS-047395 TaxID=3239936 RepID=UPI003D94696E